MSKPRNTTQRDHDRNRIKASKPACHICGNPIDYDLPYLDPMAYVVDHIVPLSKGGKDHISNKAAAHSLCNSKKRSRLVAPIIRRSGTLE